MFGRLQRKCLKSVAGVWRTLAQVFASVPRVFGPGSKSRPKFNNKNHCEAAGGGSGAEVFKSLSPFFSGVERRRVLVRQDAVVAGHWCR